MHTLQMLTYTFPVWVTALVILFFCFVAISGNIDPDYFLPIHHIPMRLLSGSVILCAFGWLLPRVVFITFPPLKGMFGSFINCWQLGIVCGVVGIVLSLVTWCIYAVVRPKEKRSKSND